MLFYQKRKYFSILSDKKSSTLLLLKEKILKLKKKLFKYFKFFDFQ